MIAYIILTYLLSISGYCIYRLLVYRRITSIWQKRSLFIIVALSLTLPVAIDKFNSTTNQTYAPCLDTHPIPEVVFTQFCPIDGSEMDMCYEKAVSQPHFCSCTNITKSNLLTFQQHKLYDWLLNSIPYLREFALLFALLLIGWLLFKILGLFYLVSTSHKEQITVSGKAYTLLHPKKAYNFASFKLWRGYIVWQPNATQLTTNAQTAILHHEISHIEQRDTWIKIILHLLQIIWWANPAFYFFRKEFDYLSEFIADEFAAKSTGNTKQYASLLLQIKRQQNLPLAHHYQPKNSELKQRVVNLVNPPQKLTPWQTAFYGIIGGFCLVLATHYTLPALAYEIDEVKLYQSLANANRLTGRSLFCKPCLLTGKYDMQFSAQADNNTYFWPN